MKKVCVLDGFWGVVVVGERGEEGGVVGGLTVVVASMVEVISLYKIWGIKKKRSFFNGNGTKYFRFTATKKFPFL